MPCSAKPDDIKLHVICPWCYSIVHVVSAFSVSRQFTFKAEGVPQKGFQHEKPPAGRGEHSYEKCLLSVKRHLLWETGYALSVICWLYKRSGRLPPP